MATIRTATVLLLVMAVGAWGSAHASADELTATHARHLAQAAVQNVYDAFNTLVQDFCYANTGAGCDEVDYDGSTGWFKDYFSGRPVLGMITYQSAMTLVSSNAAPKAFSGVTNTCPYNSASQAQCIANSKLDTSDSKTITSTTGFSVQQKVGATFKAKAGAVEGSVEFTMDFGYSFSESKGTASINGQSMAASIQVPMSPTDKRCAVVSVSLAKTSMTGKYDAYIELRGGVGTHQHPARTWKYYGGSSHYYMYHTVSTIVSSAKTLGVSRAAPWTVVPATGGALVSMHVEIPLDAPLYAYANPQLYNLTDARCKATKTKTSSTTAAAASVQLPRRLQQQEPQPQPEPQLTRRQLASSPVPLDQRMEDLMQAYCRYESGSGCETDFKGSTDWWRKYFLSSNPTSVSTGLDQAVWNKAGMSTINMNSGVLVCPYRNFSYTCKADNQLMTSTVQTTSATAGLSIGSTSKITVTTGLDFAGLAGASAGLTYSVSTSYNFQTGEAYSSTLATTNGISYSVTMDPAANPKRNCTYIMTNMNWVTLSGTQNAWIQVSGLVGVHQDPATRWKDWSNSDTHYYRAVSFSSVVRTSLAAGLPEAQGWSIASNGYARFVMPLNLVIRTASQGTSKAVQYLENSPQCKVAMPV